MTDSSLPDEPLDPLADTARFRAFVDGGDTDEARGAPVGVSFRVITLLAGLVAFGVVIWLLFLL